MGQTVLPTEIPLKAPLKHYLSFCDMKTVIPLQSHCVSTQMGGITVGYETLILSTQVKQGKYIGVIHPTAIPLKSETWPVFSLQCFHRNGWAPSGIRNFNPFFSVLLPSGMGGKLKNPSSCTVYEPGHEKTCLYYMLTTKAQISLHIQGVGKWKSSF